jgi:dihydropteroate synthase
VQAIVAGEGLDVLRAPRSGVRYWPLAGKRGNKSERRGDAPEPNSALPTTGDAAAVVAAILGGAHIVRVHDPAAILPAARVADALLAAHR